MSLYYFVKLCVRFSYVNDYWNCEMKKKHWLKINERIDYKLLSLTYKVLTTTQPSYLHNFLSPTSSLQPTRTSSLLTLSRIPASSSLRITNRSF